MAKTGRLLLCVSFVSGTIAGCGPGQQSTEDAERFQPPGEVRTELQQAPSTYVGACRKAAQRTTLSPLYCPPVIPDGELVVDSAGPFGSGQLDSYVISARSPDLPAPYVRKAKRQGRPYPPPGHWVITASGQPHETLRFIRATEGGREISKQTIGGTTTRTFVVPSGASALDAGHVIIYWQRGDVAYTVSVHAPVNELLARAVAGALIEQMARCPAPTPDCRLTLPTDPTRKRRS